MFEDMPIVSSIISIVILAIAFFLIDGIASKPEAFYGNVIDKHYKAERTSVGTGTAVGSNGNVDVVTTTEVDPEEVVEVFQYGFVICVGCHCVNEVGAKGVVALPYLAEK